MSDDAENFETLWLASGLAPVADALRPSATITARLALAAARGDTALASTLAAEQTNPGAPEGRPPFVAPREAHASLPHITLVSDELEDDAPATRTRDLEKAELRVLSVLGEGGMGRVLLARQRSLGRDVAVKVLKPEAASAAGAEALLLEARLSGSLEHPNIVPVHALGRDEHGHPVLVMKRVEGVPWRELLDDPRHAAWANVPGAAVDGEESRLDAHLELFMDVCNALHFAHTRGVVHRDLKPENVLLGPFGEVYLADWGIALRRDERDAAAPRRHAMVGTPGYMAPEMLSGDPAKVGPRTDVFLLGATLHEILTGQRRHEGKTVYEVLVNVFDCKPPVYGPEVPAELGEIAAKATARDPDERYEGARALRDAIAAYRKHRGSTALAREATARLDELREACEAARSAGASDAARASAGARVHKLGAECRFAFAQALREWPGNTVARHGLRETLLTLARYELARENADAAAALLDELGSRASEHRALRNELEALRKRLDERSARGASLEAMAHELDLRVGAQARTKMFLGMTLFVSAMGGVVVYRRSHGIPLTYERLVALSLIVFVTLGVVISASRRALLQTLVNRRIVGLVLLTAVGLFLHRMLSWRLGVRPEATLTLDTVVIGMMAAVAAITVTPWLWLLALTMILGGFAIALLGLPVEAGFTTIGLVAFSMGAYGWYRFGTGDPAKPR